jgi:hypothetical protein
MWGVGGDQDFSSETSLFLQSTIAVYPNFVRKLMPASGILSEISTCISFVSPSMVTKAGAVSTGTTSPYPIPCMMLVPIGSR